MSSGQRLKTLYQFIAGGATNLTHTCFIDCDPDTTTLSIGGVENGPPAPAAATQRQHKWYMPIHRGRATRSPRARLVTLRYTAALPPGVTSRTVEVPVLTIARYVEYRKGRNGTYKGLPVVVVSRTEGVPDITGQ